jgi:hypothetical protein
MDVLLLSLHYAQRLCDPSKRRRLLLLRGDHDNKVKFVTLARVHGVVGRGSLLRSCINQSGDSGCRDEVAALPFRSLPIIHRLVHSILIEHTRRPSARAHGRKERNDDVWRATQAVGRPSTSTSRFVERSCPS